MSWWRVENHNIQFFCKTRPLPLDGLNSLLSFILLYVKVTITLSLDLWKCFILDLLVLTRWSANYGFSLMVQLCIIRTGAL